MKLTRDEAMRQIDAATDFIYSLVGSQVQIQRSADRYSIQYESGAVVGGPDSRVPVYSEELESIERIIERETEWLPEDGYDDEDDFPTKFAPSYRGDL